MICEACGTQRHKDVAKFKVWFGFVISYLSYGAKVCLGTRVTPQKQALKQVECLTRAFLCLVMHFTGVY